HRQSTGWAPDACTVPARHAHRPLAARAYRGAVRAPADKADPRARARCRQPERMKLGRRCSLHCSLEMSPQPSDGVGRWRKILERDRASGGAILHGPIANSQPRPLRPAVAGGSDAHAEILDLQVILDAVLRAL